MRNQPSLSSNSNPQELRQAALFWLTQSTAIEKSIGVRVLKTDWHSDKLALDTSKVITYSGKLPGLPSKPELVDPKLVKKRSMATQEGRAALIHALAHIEFNAINLALDAIWRFPNMPREYYLDWLQVAAEEALHFSLLTNHLKRLGFSYGDFPAHNSLWEMAERTQGDCLARMALVPRTLEARGLDAGPSLKAKLVQVGDTLAGAILDIILRDEIGHVAIGNRWYGYLCAQRQCDPVKMYAELRVKYKAPKLKGPYNLDARRQAGFTEDELHRLDEDASSGVDL